MVQYAICWTQSPEICPKKLKRDENKTDWGFKVGFFKVISIILLNGCNRIEVGDDWVVGKKRRLFNGKYDDNVNESDVGEENQPKWILCWNKEKKCEEFWSFEVRW